MKIQLLAVGTKMPSWVEQGYQEYARRFPKDMTLELVEINAGKRGKNADIKRIFGLRLERGVFKAPEIAAQHSLF